MATIASEQHVNDELVNKQAEIKITRLNVTRFIYISGPEIS